MKRSFTLLETLVALALLAAVLTALLRVEAAAVRQLARSRARQQIVAELEQLLARWSAQGEPVTLPSSGPLSAHFRWQRAVQPVRLPAGGLATQVTVTVGDQRTPAVELLRVDWLLAEPRDGK